MAEVLIDNTSGVYDPLDIVEKLQDRLQELGGDGGEIAEAIFEIGQDPEEDRPQALHELEEEIIRDINDLLPDDLILSVGFGEQPGLYLIHELEDDGN